MIRYVINRVLLLIPVILIVSFIVFALIELAPGDIVDAMISGDMSPDEVAAMRAHYDLDKPMLYRYGKYIVNLVQGDLGISYTTRINVFSDYISKLPNTLLLSLVSSVIGVAISIPIGIRAARKAGTITDTAVTTFTLIGMSMPPFWLGLLLMLLFALQLGWLPAGGNKDGIRSLILPAICNSMALMAMCARQTRSSMLEVLNADFLRTARAKGAPEETVIRKHALGNALIPVVTVIGTSICVSLAGSAVIEQVFAWPGVGRMLVIGVLARDVPVILGCTIMTTILYVLVMLIVDLLYAFIDPRIKAQYMVAKRKRQIAEMALVKPGATDAGSPDEGSGMESKAAGDVSGAAAGTAAQMQAEISQQSMSMLQATDVAVGSNPYDSTDNSYSGARDYMTRQDENITVRDTVGDVAEVMSRYKKRSQIGEIMHSLVRNKSSLAGIIILGLIVLIAIGSLFIPFSAVTASNMPDRFSPPSWRYPFGTDNMGRDTFLRVLYGTRYSIIIGFGAVAVSAFFGIVLGSVAAYYSGRTDNIIMRISDIMASIPGLLLAMVIMVTLGFNMQNLVIAVGIGGIPAFMRMSRASILTVKGNEFIEAARAIGFSDLRIIITQLLPNGLSPLLVQATTLLGLSITISAALSFLGFGIPPPTPEWGTLVSVGRDYARTAPWLMTFPGLFIMITVLGFNLLGDGLRDALDPKLKK